MSTKSIRLLMELQDQICPVPRDDYISRAVLIELLFGVRVSPSKLQRTKPFKKIIYKTSLTFSNNKAVWKKQLRKRNVNRN